MLQNINPLDRRASYQEVEVTDSDAFVGFEDTAARSDRTCAMDCSKTPACHSFRFQGGLCSLGGYTWI